VFFKGLLLFRSHNSCHHATGLSPLIIPHSKNWDAPDTFCVIRLSVVYRGRAIPLIWRVLEHGSSSVKFIVTHDLLDKAARLLPEGRKVV